MTKPGERIDLSAPCSHVTAEMPRHTERPARGCKECLEGGTRWVHLRTCLSCGHVGCCDSSPMKHATAHFRETKHPIVTSAEIGETWTWCYVHEAFLSSE